MRLKDNVQSAAACNSCDLVSTLLSRLHCVTVKANVLLVLPETHMLKSYTGMIRCKGVPAGLYSAAHMAGKLQLALRQPHT